MGIPIRETGFNFDILPSVITDPILVEKYTGIIRSWGRKDGDMSGIYDGELSNIIFGGSMLGFCHDGELIYCPAESKEVHEVRIHIASKIEANMSMAH